MTTTRSKKRRTARIVALVVVGLLALTGCRSNTQSNEVGVHVTGGVIFPTSAVIKDCVPASTNKYVGVGDDVYLYPSGQRSFTFDDKKGADFPPVTVVSKDNVTLTLSGTISFTLNTDCDTLKKFHQQIGSKVWGGSRAYVNDGFDGFVNMEDVEIGKPLQNALTDATDSFGYQALYTEAAVRKQLETDLANSLEGRVKALTGADYFQNFKVLINKPQVPQNIEDALNAQAAAVAQNTAQKAKNATALTAYQQVKQCKALGISEAQCVILFGINTGAVTVVPGGTSVTLPAKP